MTSDKTSLVRDIVESRANKSYMVTAATTIKIIRNMQYCWHLNWGTDKKVFREANQTSSFFSSPQQRLMKSVMHYHCLKSISIRSFSCTYFLSFRLNTDQKNSDWIHFLRSEYCANNKKNYMTQCSFTHMN